jgi:hypothetical protein
VGVDGLHHFAEKGAHNRRTVVPANQITLTPEHLHALSNHLAVILGFVELLLADTPEGTQPHADLLEIRTAALEAARMIGLRPRST